MGAGGGNVPIIPEFEGQSALIQPVDREYKEHGQPRQEHLEFKTDNVSHAILSQQTPYTAKEMRVRKLTPKECWRLMGFKDEDFEKAKVVNSNTQLYKQAGNSIVVDVLEKILKNLLKGEKKDDPSLEIAQPNN